jgi:hypothetical protein
MARGVLWAVPGLFSTVPGQKTWAVCRPGQICRHTSCHGASPHQPIGFPGERNIPSVFDPFPFHGFLALWSLECASPHPGPFAQIHCPTNMSTVPVHPNFLRRLLHRNASPPCRSRFSFGATPQRSVNETTADATRRRQSQTVRAAPNEAVWENGGMGRKGKDTGGGISEATLVRITKVLEEFRASDAEGSLASFLFGGCFGT